MHFIGIKIQRNSIGETSHKFNITIISSLKMCSVRHYHALLQKKNINKDYSIIQNKDKMSQREDIYIRKIKGVIY